MSNIRVSKKYIKGRLRCEKRGWDLKKLDDIVHILSTRPFTPAEIVKHKVHELKGNMNGYMELHIINRHHNWVLVYTIENNTLILDNLIITLENTGTHDECLR